MKLIKGRPLIRNATHPDILFTDDEKEHIRKAIGVTYQRERYNRAVRVDEPDRQTRGDLLRLARFHGYFTNGVDSNKNILWACMTQNKWRTPQVVISIMPCDECSTNFHSYHYEDEPTVSLCDSCESKRKGPRIVPPELKTIPSGRASSVA